MDATGQISLVGQELSYRRALAADAATPTIIQSVNLTDWSPAGASPVSIINNGDGTETITVRLADPTVGRRYFAIRWVATLP